MAAAAAVTVLLEGIGLAGVHWILGLSVREQHMSVAGVSTGAMSGATWGTGAVLGALLLAAAVLLARAALRGRLGGSLVRAALVGVLVLNGGIAVLAVGLLGWTVFTAAMGVFGLVLAALLAYPRPEGGRSGPEPGGPDGLPGRPDEAEQALTPTGP